MQENTDKSTQYELAKLMAKKDSPLDMDKHREDFEKAIKQVLMNKINGEYYALMAPQMRYFTMFVKQDETKVIDMAKEIAKFIEEEAEAIGKIKGFSFDNKKKALEVWLDDEIYYLFNYDLGIVKI